MNKKIKPCAFFILLLSFAFILLPIGADATESGGEPEYYGRYALSTLPNAEALLFAYDAISEGIENSAPLITVDNGKGGLTVDELNVVTDAYRRDRTEHFWANGGNISYNSSTGKAIQYAPDYIMSGAELSEARAAFDAAADEILLGITDSMSEFEKELYLHDALAKRVMYVDTENAHNAYGALVKGKAVCDGYSEAFQYLLQRAGIQSFIAIGSSYDPNTYEDVGHAWNIVRIDGEYYHVDVTWDDQGKKLYHAYFNLTDTEILYDHEIDPTVYPLPSCASAVSNYYSLRGITLTNFDIPTVAELIRNNAPQLKMRISGHVHSAKNFILWFDANFQDIASLAAVSGNYSYSVLRCEVIIEISTCPHTEKTKVDPTPASCENDGNILHYVCVCGEIFSDTGSVLKEEDVVILATGHTAAAGFGADGEYHWLVCSVCGGSYSFGAHLYTDACDALCNTCNGERIPPHKHKTEFSSDDQNHWNECSCGDKKNVAPHSDTDGDGLCDECGFDLKIGESEDFLKDLINRVKGDKKMLIILLGGSLFFTVLLLAVITRIFRR